MNLVWTDLVAGLAGSCAPYPFSVLAGRRDDKDLISLTQPTVNNQNSAMQSERVVREGMRLKKRPDTVGQPPSKF
jgi:hypothetical protein